MTSSVLAAFLLPLVVSTMAVELPYFCSFEDIGLCEMEPREGGDFNWIRQNGKTPSNGTGPDGAVVGLWYIYIESSHDAPDNRKTGDKAYIQTPTIEYTGEVCIHFQYHMYGQHIGRLVVYVDTRRENRIAVLNKSENQNNTWHQVTVNVKDFNTESRVVFMAEVGDGYQGDIALDDLHIANGMCHECQINNGGCEQICLPDSGWVNCSCHDGHIKDGPKCIPVSSPPSRTSKRPSITTDLYTLSATKAPDTSALTNTTSPVERTTTTTQPTSTTTARVTGRQTPSITTASLTGSQTPSMTTANLTGSQTPSMTTANLTGSQTPSMTTANLTGSQTPSMTTANLTGSQTPSMTTASLTGSQTPSMTTARVTEQQTEKTTLEDQLVMTSSGDSRSNDEDRRIAYIVVGVLAAVVLAVGVVLLVICVIRRRRSADGDGSPQPKTSFLLPLHFPKRARKEQVSPHGDDSEPIVTQREPKLSARLSRLSLTLTRLLTAPKPTDASGQHDLEAASVTAAEPPPELLRKIPGEDFPSYVTGQKSKRALALEFKDIPYRLHPCTEAVRPMHKTRNRFLNILPYDRNRVTLEQQGEEIETRYINASFIKMYREDEIFIASQGPTHATINDFWRMVWEQDVGLVVMLTKVEEGDKKRKCERYWPEEGSESYGSFIVENKSTVYWPDFILRTFAVAMRDDPDEWRYVKQLHFISWLDHVVPNDITTLLRFHRRMRRDMVAGKSTVIHCSAGVGRTGTLMAIDYLMDQLQEEGELGVYECVYNLRGERMSMVQSQAQYIFVHDAVAEIVTLGETTIPCTTFKEGVSFNKVAKEFQALEQAKPKKINEDTKLALSKVNKKKNRDPSIYPRILKRVPLTSGIKGRNDYINAVTVNSHHKKIAYIATQTPLVDTQIDFWRMIHDYQCRCIVILDSEVEDWLPSDSNKEIVIHQYYLAMTSSETSVSGEVVLFDAVVYKGDFNEPQTSDIRTLDHRRPTNKAAQPPAEPEPAPAQEPEEKDDGISVTTETDDEPAEVVTHPAETEYMNNAEVSAMKRMEQNAVRFGVIQCPLESYTDLTSSLLSQVFSSVQERQKQWPDSPIVVVSRDGAELCGLAITFFSALEMMREEREVDLYHVVKQAKECRPEFICSLAQYKYLHTLMENSIQQCGDYQNAT